jgi:hypothetical protein
MENCVIVNASGRQLDQLREEASRISRGHKVDWWSSAVTKGHGSASRTLKRKKRSPPSAKTSPFGALKSNRWVTRVRDRTPIHELERYLRCQPCSELQGYPRSKRSHLIALRATKISAQRSAVALVAWRAIGTKVPREV